MMAGTTNFPNNFSNLRGIPMIASISVEVTATNVVIGIPKRAFRGLADSGIIAFRLNQEIPTAGASLPVMISSNEFTQTLTVLGGASATGTEISSVGVYLVWYDKCANTMQLLTTII
jgi:hypothetical protein